jgi:Flp pilus assembly protein TadG
MIGTLRRAARWELGTAVVEAAVSLPLLAMVTLALVQFALFVHAGHVAAAAAQDGARVAASDGRTVAEGVAHAHALLEAGLGRSIGEVSVRGAEQGDLVVVEVSGRLRMVVPWVVDVTLPVAGRAAVASERFRAGPPGAVGRVR